MFAKIAIVLISLLQLISNGLCQTNGDNAANGMHSVKIGVPVDLTSYLINGYDSKFIGVADDQEFVTAVTMSSHTSSIDFWNIKSGKIEGHIQPADPILAWAASLSPDGRTLLAGQNDLMAALEHAHNQNSHKMFLWDTHTKKLLHTIDVGQDKNVLGAVFLPKTNGLILSLDTDAPNSLSYRYYTGPQFGEDYREVKSPQQSALDAESTVFSPDGKLMVSVSGTGEGDQGTLSVFEARTGKLLQTFTGSPKVRPISPPYFFLSDHQFVCGRLVFDVKAHRVSPLFHTQDVRRKAVSNLPLHPGYAFFLTDKGLELWNVPDNRMTYRWSEIHQADEIYFSPSMRLMCVSEHPADDYQKLQFWTFDLHLLSHSPPSNPASAPEPSVAAVNLNLKGDKKKHDR